MMIDATTAWVPVLVQIWVSGITALYDAMHSVIIFGVPLDAMVALLIFLNVMITLYVRVIR